MSCPSSIWCQESNSRPLEHESPPITARPGLPPQWLLLTKELHALIQYLLQELSAAYSDGVSVVQVAPSTVVVRFHEKEISSTISTQIQIEKIRITNSYLFLIGTEWETFPFFTHSSYQGNCLMIRTMQLVPKGLFTLVAGCCDCRSELQHCRYWNFLSPCRNATLCCVQNNLAYFPFMHCPLVANRKARWSIT